MNYSIGRTLVLSLWVVYVVIIVALPYQVNLWVHIFTIIVALISIEEFGEKIDKAIKRRKTNE